MPNITKKAALTITADLDRLANLVSSEAKALGLNPKLAAQFVHACDCVSDAVEKKASVHKMGGHHQEGSNWYADTAFINQVQYVYPGAELKHMGFGEFELVTPDGTLEFDRMRGVPFEGMSGRSHKLYDNANGKVVQKAVALMEQKGKSEKTASDWKRTPDGTDFKNQRQAELNPPDKAEYMVIDSGDTIYAYYWAGRVDQYYLSPQNPTDVRIMVKELVRHMRQQSGTSVKTDQDKFLETIDDFVKENIGRKVPPVKWVIKNWDDKRFFLRVAREISASASTDWKRTPDGTEFKEDPKVSKMYGEYVFWLLHHDGSPAQKGMADKIQRDLTRIGFTGWGLQVAQWPLAKAAYLALARKQGMSPADAAREISASASTDQTASHGYNRYR